jgi:hypothetical protein
MIETLINFVRCKRLHFPSSCKLLTHVVHIFVVAVRFAFHDCGTFDPRQISTPDLIGGCMACLSVPCTDPAGGPPGLCEFSAPESNGMQQYSMNVLGFWLNVNATDGTPINQLISL